MPHVPTAPLANREPATPPATMTTVRDEQLFVTPGSAADFSAWRTTAVPAGSRGRVTVSGRQMLENGAPVKFNVFHLQPDNTFTPIPADRALVYNAMQNIARGGFNAIRIMGIEHWLMRGQDGAAEFVLDWWDRYDYLLWAAKAAGLYWILTVQSYCLFEDLNGQVSRYTYTDSTNNKARIFVEQNVRDNWALGVGKLWNRVNPYTGTRILQDPALLMLEIYNESSAEFCCNKVAPPTWLQRNAGATPAAKTWVEWLSDPAMAHGYANVAALNASWGTAHANFAAAAAQALPILELSVVPSTQQTIDWVLFGRYIEADLAAFYSASLDAMGYTGIRSLHTVYPSMNETRNLQAMGNVNHVANGHNYDNLANETEAPITNQRAETPLWEYEYPALMHLWSGGSLPIWAGEGGSMSWATWREAWPLVAAAGASSGARCITNFLEGDPFTSRYYNDTTPHGDRWRRLHNFANAGAHTRDFSRLLLAAIYTRGDVDELPETGAVSIPLNDRFLGLSPRNPGRVRSVLAGLLLPLYPLAGVVKTRLNYTADTADDSLTTTWYPKTWFTLLSEAVSAGAITNTHPSYVSANTNRGTVTAIATSGTVGGLAASVTQPVLTLSAAHTLVDGDVIHVTNISGTAGTGLRHNRTRVKVGTGNNVRCESGLDLTGYSGYATADWCEGANVLVSAHQQWGWSRRDKCGWINTARTVMFTSTSGATFPKTYGVLTITAIDADVTIAVVSLDGQPLATSSRIAVALCGVAENTGMTFGDSTRQVCTATGNYPIKQRDCTAQIQLQLTAPLDWTLYRCARSGDRTVRESLDAVNVSTGRLQITLRVGTVQPSPMWELVR